MKVNIPVRSKSESGAPLQACITRVAREMGLREFEVVEVMEPFLQELAEQVAEGKMVRIPGFGAFGPKASESVSNATSVRYCYPAFSGSRALRNYLRTCCPPECLDIEPRRNRTRITLEDIQSQWRSE